jgi:hypothetical protein
MNSSIFAANSSIFRNPRFFKPLVAIGLSAVLYGGIRLVYKGYRYYKDQLTLFRFLSNYCHQTKAEKEWIVIVSLENINDSFMKMVTMVSQMFHIILVWDNKQVSESIFLQIQKLPGTMVRIIPFDVDENLDKFMSDFSAEITETRSRIFFVQHKEYTGEALYDKQEAIGSSNEINYCVRKFQCMAACLSTFISVAKVSNLKPTVLLDFKSKYSNLFDSIIVNALRIFLKNAQKEYPFQLKTLVD